MRKMKICLVAHTNDLSGSNRALVELAESMKAKNINYIVVLPRKGAVEKLLKEKRIDYKILWYTSWIDKPQNYKRIVKIIINYIGGINFILFCIFNKISLVHYNSAAVGIGVHFLYKMKIPYVWHIREYIDNKSMKFHSINRTLHAFENAKYLIGISKSVIQKNIEDGRTGNWICISDGIPIIDLNYYSNEAYKKAIIVGGIEKNKNQIDAIKAVKFLIDKMNREISLYIVGPIIDYEYYNNLIDYIKENNLEKNIIWMGRVDAPSIIRTKCGIALVCSQYEAFGRVTVEAIMSGESVIGVSEGGTLEILSQINTGMMYRAGNVMELCACIVKAMEIGYVEERVVKARNRAIDLYSSDNTFNRIIALYNLVLSEL